MLHLFNLPFCGCCCHRLFDIRLFTLPDSPGSPSALEPRKQPLPCLFSDVLHCQSPCLTFPVTSGRLQGRDWHLGGLRLLAGQAGAFSDCPSWHAPGQRTDRLLLSGPSSPRGLAPAVGIRRGCWHETFVSTIICCWKTSPGRCLKTLNQGGSGRWEKRSRRERGKEPAACSLGDSGSGSVLASMPSASSDTHTAEWEGGYSQRHLAADTLSASQPGFSQGCAGSKNSRSLGAPEASLENLWSGGPWPKWRVNATPIIQPEIFLLAIALLGAPNKTLNCTYPISHTFLLIEPLKHRTLEAPGSPLLQSKVLRKDE